MSNVTDRNVIDIITMEDRNLVMIIFDTLPWTFQTRAAHRNALVTKVNDYLGYVYGGQVSYIHTRHKGFSCVNTHDTKGFPVDSNRVA